MYYWQLTPCHFQYAEDADGRARSDIHGGSQKAQAGKMPKGQGWTV
jgi:hypothetical protein